MGVLESFKPVGFENIRDEFKDPDGDFSVFRMFAFLPQYAKNGLSTTPHELTDLLSDEYRGKIVSTYPHDDVVLYVYDEMIKQYGMKFVEDFARTEPFFVRGTAGPPLLVGMNAF